MNSSCSLKNLQKEWENLKLGKIKKMKKTKEKIDVVIEKLEVIENYLKKLTGLIPEESLKVIEIFPFLFERDRRYTLLKRQINKKKNGNC